MSDVKGSLMSKKSLEAVSRAPALAIALAAFDAGRPNKPAPEPSPCQDCGALQHPQWVGIFDKWVTTDVCESCLSKRAAREQDSSTSSRERGARLYGRLVLASGLEQPRYLRYSKHNPDCAHEALAWVLEDKLVSGYVRGSKRATQRFAAELAEYYCQRQAKKMNRAASVMLVHEADLYQRIKAGFDGHENGLTLSDVRDTRLLILDGAGSVPVQIWEQRTLNTILEYRESAQLPTILLGELAWGELAERPPFSWSRGLLGEHLSARYEIEAFGSVEPGYSEVHPKSADTW